MQANLDGPVGDAETAGDRRLGQVLVVAQADQLPVTLVERLQRGVQVGPFDRRQHPLVVDALIALERVEQGGSLAAVLAEGLVADDRRQPRLAAIGIAQGRAALPGPQNGVVGDVLGLDPALRIAICESHANPANLVPVPAITRLAPLDTPVIKTVNLHDAEQTSRSDR